MHITNVSIQRAMPHMINTKRLLMAILLTFIASVISNASFAFDDSEVEEILLINAYEGDTKKVKELLSRGVDVNAVGEHGETPLLAAVNSGKIDIVALLLAHGANLEARNFQESTPLILACQYGHATISAMLVEMGADLSVRDFNGYDSLMIAAARGHDLVVRQLLFFGADTTLTNKHGNTALNLAMYSGHSNVVTTLLEKGDPKQLIIENKEGLDALSFAKQLDNPAIIDIVKKYAK